MSDAPQADTYAALPARARQGDESATNRLVERLTPAIRRVVRARLTDPRLKRLMDPEDVC